MNMRGQRRQHAPIKPQGSGSGPEYNQQSLNLSGRKVPVPAGGGAKGAMIDGPFGGKVKA